jgi:hypothetical protein
MKRMENCQPTPYSQFRSSDLYEILTVDAHAIGVLIGTIKGF